MLQYSWYRSSKALLVIPLKIDTSKIDGTNYRVLKCQFISTIYTWLEWGDSYTITVRLGKLESDPIINAKASIDEYDYTNGSEMVMPPKEDELVSIREARKKVLAPTERA